VAFDELMGLTNRLLAHGLALAAIAARPRLDELGERGDPALREQPDRVVDELLNLPRAIRRATVRRRE
jgi:hypothetical protein